MLETVFHNSPSDPPPHVHEESAQVKCALFWRTLYLCSGPDKAQYLPAEALFLMNDSITSDLTAFHLHYTQR